MKTKLRKNGSVLVMVVFVTAMLATLVAGILHMNTEEIQLAQHRVYAVQALALAEAGLNEALAEIRQDSSWTTGIEDKELAAVSAFKGGEYTVDVNDTTLTISASVTSWQGYTATIEAQITVSDGNSPHIIRIDNIKVNDNTG